MEKQILKTSIEIRASKDKIWDVLLQDKTYRQWTKPFSEGSHAVTDWKEGSKVYFKDSSGDGMVSRVALHKPGEIISIEHLGFLKDGKEDYDNPEIKQWQGAKETYKLTENNGICRLDIEQDVSEEESEWMSQAWEKSLQIIKDLSE
jgi:hypothetical protein